MAEPELEFLRRRMRQLETEIDVSNAAAGVAMGGGGPHDPGMEARVAKLESDVGHIQRDVSDIKTDVREIRTVMEKDFRLLFGALITVAIALAGLMAKGFHWL
jgi:hypothetical protein